MSADPIQAEGEGEPPRTMFERLRPAGSARKVSVSMPEDLTAAVQRRVGHGKFSQYVTEAVTRQLRAAWPDGE